MLQLAVAAAAKAAAKQPLFNGKTLDGWTQIENSATSVSSANILDPASLASKLIHSDDATSVGLRSMMDDAQKADLAAFSPSAANAKTVIGALAKFLNQAMAARPGTLRQNKVALEEAYPTEIARSATTGWEVKDGAMASTGAGRGVIYTAQDYTRFRLMFTMRHVSGNPDHQACILIFCTRPQGGQAALDALGAIQFQAPNGGHWDYRPGMNDSGGEQFTSITKTHFDPHEWSRVEILADASKGTARMAVAQPLGSRALEVLSFRNPAAGKAGPIAWQMHNAGLFDEYKDVTIETDPKEDTLISIA